MKHAWVTECDWLAKYGNYHLVASAGKGYVNSTVSAQHAANIEYDWLAARYGLPHRLDSPMLHGAFFF